MHAQSAIHMPKLRLNTAGIIFAGKGSTIKMLRLLFVVILCFAGPSRFTQAATLAIPTVDTAHSSVSAGAGARNITAGDSTDNNHSEPAHTIRIGFFYLDETIKNLGIHETYLSLSERVKQANRALSNSNIPGQFIFEHLAPWPHSNHERFHDNNAYNTYLDMAPTIRQLSSSGYFTRYGIDVALLIDYRVKDPYCGWASINTLEELINNSHERSYGLIRLGAGCGLESLALIHELGHLFGAAHGLGQDVTPSDPRGHGYICNDKHTIMHTRHAKHLFFSSPWREENGALCGTPNQANVQALITERFHLLAQRTLEPENFASLSLNTHYDKDTQSLTMSFERFGWVDPTASLDFHVQNSKASASPTLTNVSFAQGELVKTHVLQISPKEMEEATIILLNAENIDLPYKLKKLSEINGGFGLAINYRTQAQTVHLDLTQNSAENTTNTDGTWSALALEWGDGTNTALDEHNFSHPLSAEHTYENPGIYDVRFTGYDVQGTYQEHTLSVNVGTPDKPGTIERGLENNVATMTENTAQESSGGVTDRLGVMLFSLFLLLRRTLKGAALKFMQLKNEVTFQEGFPRNNAPERGEMESSLERTETPKTHEDEPEPTQCHPIYFQAQAAWPPNWRSPLAAALLKTRCHRPDQSVHARKHPLEHHQLLARHLHRHHYKAMPPLCGLHPLVQLPHQPLSQPQL